MVGEGERGCIIAARLGSGGLSEGIPFAHSRLTSCEAPRAIPLRRYPAATGNSKPLTGIPSDSPAVLLRKTLGPQSGIVGERL